MQFLKEPTRLVRNIERVGEAVDGSIDELIVSPGFVVVEDGGIVNPYLRHPVTGEMSWRKRAFACAVMSLLDVAAPPVEAIIERVISGHDGEEALIDVPRLGQDGKLFMQYKYRTMHAGTEKQPHNGAPKVADDPRITKIAKKFKLRELSLDELAQRNNYHEGDMTLVGPRPEAPEQEDCRRADYEAVLGSDYEERYERARQAKFMCVPGITGLTQVTGRSRYYREENGLFRSGELNRVYAETANLEMDMRIAAETLPAIVTRRGAC